MLMDASASWEFLVVVALLAVIASIPGLWTGRLIDKIEGLLARIGRRRVPAFFLLFFGAIVVRLAVLPLLEVPIPGIHDEYSYLLMGDTFAHWRLANPTHPMWRSFETFHVIWHPTYASIYPPAQGFALAIGEWLGLPWIGVLLTAACMGAVIYWMLCAWMPPHWAFLGGALAALKLEIASYWVNSYWGGAVAAIGGALVLGALPRIFKKGHIRDALLLGLGVAILANSRPYEGLVFCLLPAVAFLLWLFGKKNPSVAKSRRWKAVLLPLASVLVLTLAFMGYYNWRVTRDPLLFPHTLNWREFHTAAMFLWQAPKPEKHYDNERFEEYYNDWERDEYHRTLRDAIDVSWTKTWRMASAFFWWGLILVLPGVLAALRERRMRFLWLTLAATMLAVYAVTFSNAHYAAPATCLVFALIVESIRHLRARKLGRFHWGKALARAAVFLLLVDTGAHVARKECDQQDWTCPRDYGRAGIEKKLESLPGKQLVMVRYSGDEGDLSIHDEWVYNGADIDSQKVVWARELDEEQNKRLFAYFKDRTVWLASSNDDQASLVPYTPPDE
ncbi:MAG TPA: hypothetical protein VLV88_00565 [Terriglobales bacterium]|nr:hypothetical protein [Terriglobales bacterium]